MSGERRSERSQSMVEFALVAPILFLMLFGVLDLGRALYYYITIQQAASEGGRVAVRASLGYQDFHGNVPGAPTDVDVQAAVSSKAAATFLAPTCPNGPIPPIPSNPTPGTDIPYANQGWIFITDPSGSGSPNAPQGGYIKTDPAGTTIPAGCTTIKPAGGNQPLRVTIEYNFVPITPLISQAIGNRVILTAWSVYRAEYAN